MNDRKAREYLDELQDELKLAAAIAKEHSEVEQERYLAIHNACAKDKKFQVGDLVLVLMPSSSNKLLSTWQGPCTVTNIVRDNVYRIAFQDGSVKTLHSDILRRFIHRVNSVAVLFSDNDPDEMRLGEIETIPVFSSASPEFETELAGLDLGHLSIVQQSELKDVLRRYNKVFSNQPGLCKTAVHHIELVSDFKPTPQRTYRIPDALVPEVERQLADLLERGKIRPSQSPIAHPLLCVPKPNGDIRLCTDLRYINRYTIPSEYRSPRQEDILNRMSRAKFITTLDFCQGFFQIPIREQDRYKTAFRFQSKIYEWNVSPFGLCSSTAIFQQALDDILAPHHEYSEAYVDDVEIHSDFWDRHKLEIAAVLQSIAESGMTLRLSKCQFAKSRVKFLGHNVGSGMITPLVDKVDAIKAMPEPGTKK